MIRSLGMNNKYKAQLIFFYWQKIVGEAIAAQASPADISFGTLVLTARSSVWANNLLMMKLDLIAKINRFVGDTVIKDIRFRGYSWQEEAAEEAAPVEEMATEAPAEEAAADGITLRWRTRPDNQAEIGRKIARCGLGANLGEWGSWGREELLAVVRNLPSAPGPSVCPRGARNAAAALLRAPGGRGS